MPRPDPVRRRVPTSEQRREWAVFALFALVMAAGAALVYLIISFS
jgi:nitrate reductase NapE component